MCVIYNIADILSGVIDFLLLIKFIDLFLKPKFQLKHVKITFLSFLCLLIILHILSQFSDSYLFTFLYMVIYLVYVNSRYQGSIYKKTFIIICEPFVLGFFGAIFGLILQKLLWNDVTSNDEYSIYSSLRIYISYITTYIIINLIEIKKNKMNNNYKNPYTQSIIILLMLTFFFLISITSYYYHSDFTKSSFEILITIIFICVMLIILCTIWLYNMLLKQLQHEYELNLQLQFKELQDDYYDKITSSAESLRSLRHDLKNHLIAVDGYLAREKTSEARAYIKDIIQTTIDANSIVNLENIMLSSVLTQKKKLCAEKQIAFHFNVSMGLHTISDTDLCILIGNILDNATEASQLVPDQKGYIDLDISDTNEVLSIHCTNNYIQEPVMQNGRLLTTKRNRILHGIGMQNIANMVSKYDGTLDYHYANHVFTIVILLKY